MIKGLNAHAQIDATVRLKWRPLLLIVNQAITAVEGTKDCLSFCPLVQERTSSTMSKKNGAKFCSQQFLVIIILLLLAPSATISQKDGDVKLINGPTSYQGTVAVYYKNAWGTICDHRWILNYASVICRQLGHVRAERALHSAYYGQGPGRILVDQIRCPYGTSHILECTPKMKDWGIHDCTHLEDAGVDCLRKTPRRKPISMPLQLRCPDFMQSGSCRNCSSRIQPTCVNQTLVEGVVFAQYNNIWRPVSGEGFGEEEAKVVCSELGYTLSSPGPPLSVLWSNWDGRYCRRNSSASLSEGSGDSNILQPIPCSPGEVASNNAFRSSLQSTLLRNLECKGDERRLLDCYFSEFGPRFVIPMSVATVRCGFKPHPSCNSTCNV